MKTFSLAVIFTMVASAMAADPTWFLPEANNTCTGHEADGSITCELGHIGNAPLLDTSSSTPAIRGRSADPLDKRVTCNVPFLAGSSCFAHCAAIGYCNSECDGSICRCKCRNLAPILRCSRTTCS